MAVADRGERFHAKEKRLWKRAGRHIRDAVADAIQRAEDKVDRDVADKEKKRELRPRQ